MNGKLFLGIDGGATRCRARLVNEAGKTLGEGQGGPANPRFGVEAAVKEIMRATRIAVAKAGLDSSMYGRIVAGLGLAGVGQKSDHDAMMQWKHPFADMGLVTDAVAACLGAHRGEDGAVVIVGTGSCGTAIVDGREVRVGGWGFPISDQASGAWIGLEAIRHALLANDEVEAKGKLAEGVLAKFDGDPERIVAWMPTASSRHYAEFAPIVFDTGLVDPAAQRILTQACRDIARYISTLRGSGARRVCLLGGLAEPMRPWMPADLRNSLSHAHGDAMDGAILVARAVAASTQPTDVEE